MNYKYLKPDSLLENRYLIVKLLAVGGMGAVYEAKDKHLNKTVALKETLFTTDYFRKQFEREAQLLAHLSHSGLPKVTDHFIDEHGQFLVMEFIVGQDLKALLDARRSPFPDKQIMTWCDELLDILQYLHSNSVFHRDIKPQNLKLNGQGKVILIDFGLAKGAASDMTHLGEGKTILGCTPEYAPLEQLLRVEQAAHQKTSSLNIAKLEQIKVEYTDQRADLYSLAATMYHLITGFVPTNSKDRYLATMQGQVDPLLDANTICAGVPVPVAMFLKKGMAILRGERFDNATVMRKALHQVMNHIKTIVEIPPSLEDNNHMQSKVQDIKPRLVIKGIKKSEKDKLHPRTMPENVKLNPVAPYGKGGGGAKAIKLNRASDPRKNNEKNLGPSIEYGKGVKGSEKAKASSKLQPGTPKHAPIYKDADKVADGAKPRAVKLNRPPSSRKDKV